MKFLVVSDLHLHTWKYGADHGSSFNNRLSYQTAYMTNMLLYAAQNNIKHVFFCGDWFHTHGVVSSESLMATSSILSELQGLDVQLYVIAGNHDFADKNGFIHSLSPLVGWPNVHVITGSILDGSLMIKGFPPIAFLSYTENQAQLNHDLLSSPSQSLVFMHQGVSGVEVNSKGFTLNEILQPAMIGSNILHTFSGHYHSYKRVTTNLTIPGAPMQHNWGDRGDERGFLEVLLDGDTLHIKRVLNTNCPKFVECELDNISSSIVNDNFVRVVSSDTKLDIESARTSVLKMGARTVEVEIKYAEEAAIDDKDFTTYEDLFKEYVADQDIKGRKLEIGQEILANNYEAPEV